MGEDVENLRKEVQEMKLQASFFSKGIEAFLEAQMEQFKGSRLNDFQLYKRFMATQMASAIESMEAYIQQRFETQLPREPYEKALATVNHLSSRSQELLPSLEHILRNQQDAIQTAIAPLHATIQQSIAQIPIQIEQNLAQYKQKIQFLEGQNKLLEMNLQKTKQELDAVQSQIHQITDNHSAQFRSIQETITTSNEELTKTRNQHADQHTRLVHELLAIDKKLADRIDANKTALDECVKRIDTIISQNMDSRIEQVHTNFTILNKTIQSQKEASEVTRAQQAKQFETQIDMIGKRIDDTTTLYMSEIKNLKSSIDTIHTVHIPAIEKENKSLEESILRRIQDANRQLETKLEKVSFPAIEKQIRAMETKYTKQENDIKSDIQSIQSFIQSLHDRVETDYIPNLTQKIAALNKLVSITQQENDSQIILVKSMIDNSIKTLSETIQKRIDTSIESFQETNTQALSAFQKTINDTNTESFSRVRADIEKDSFQKMTIFKQRFEDTVRLLDEKHSKKIDTNTAALADIVTNIKTLESMFEQSIDSKLRSVYDTFREQEQNYTIQQNEFESKLDTLSNSLPSLRSTLLETIEQTVKSLQQTLETNITTVKHTLQSRQVIYDSKQTEFQSSLSELASMFHTFETNGFQTVEKALDVKIKHVRQTLEAKQIRYDTKYNELESKLLSYSDLEKMNKSIQKDLTTLQEFVQNKFLSYDSKILSFSVQPKYNESIQSDLVKLQEFVRTKFSQYESNVGSLLQPMYQIPQKKNIPIEVKEIVPTGRLTQKRCFVSACIGNKGQTVDKIQPFIPVPGWDYILFTNLKSIGKTPWSLRPVERQFDDPAMDAKMYKWLTHEFLPEYDIVVWIDCYLSPNPMRIQEFEGSIEKICIQEEKGIFHRTHSDRICIWDECDAVVKTRRATATDVSKNRALLEAIQMPRKYGLYDTNILVKMNKNSEVQRICKEIFETMKRASNRDQLAVTYVYYKEQFTNYTSDDLMKYFLKTGNHVRIPAYL